ncbi:hypothetical protein TOPH_04554 [Tolypocladium ophioglossoides CBS 100239]|uniref:NAD(P)-binding domain-containing protein n=1 Tax=Tolypocladium ophioglossoides (strain CBS 100239) TaxID=1163406 RepID=A0A0L0N9X5_TOLOC|nr:hypothetical protein TOPH_04554 [Tolypocladium ophioglossoides CBS 100239]
MPSPKTITFFGATAGCGLSALRRALAAGHTCVALCRKPAKMDALFPDKPANLVLKQGNAHDAAAVAAVLTCPGDATRLVDAVSFSIGAAVRMPSMTMDDPHVCEKGMATLLEALATLRAAGASGRPLVTMVSTTGISPHGRDVPLLLVPLYHLALRVPHEDKRIAENRLMASGERFVIVRASLLVDGEKPDREVRVHVEGRGGIERKAVGYYISREDVGRWMFENLLRSAGASEYECKAVGLTW